MDTQTTTFNTKIFIGGISVKMTEGTMIYIQGIFSNLLLDELRTYFAQYGKIKNFVLVKSKKTNQPLGFGFVEY
jgi:RNA recognition motif-containing protein